MRDGEQYDGGRAAGKAGSWHLLRALASAFTVLMAGGAMTACAAQPEPLPESKPVPPAPTTFTAAPVQPTTRADRPVRPAQTPRAALPSPELLVALATADAARQTQAGPSDVRIVQVEAREWPDRSLGCPRPGLGYAQSITPGYLIVVEAQGQRLEYHTDHAEVLLCGS